MPDNVVDSTSHLDDWRGVGYLVEIATERLDESGETGDVAARHAEYFGGLATDIGAGIEGIEQLAWMERGMTDEANIQAAFSELNTQNYRRAFADDFTFTPTSASLAQNASIWTGWGSAQEEEYFRHGQRRTSAEFDDRSTAFGIASVCYSRAVTDLVNLYYFVWRQAGGDVRSASLMRGSNLVLNAN